MPVGRVALINKSLSKYFLQFLFTKIVIPAQAGIGTLNRAQRSRDKKLILRRVIPAQAGIHCVLLNFETGWNTIAPDLVSPTKIVIPAQAGIYCPAGTA